jgi:hypothetical protein
MRDKWGQYAADTIKCDSGYPCDLTYSRGDCVNRRKCAKIMDAEIREELAQSNRCAFCGFRFIRGGCVNLGVPSYGCAERIT